LKRQQFFVIDLVNAKWFSIVKFGGAIDGVIQKLMKLFLTIGFLLLWTVSFPQNTFHFDQSIPVEVGGKPIAMPWAGGLNSPQLSTMDLNGDGKDDLVAFDRTANKIFTYLTIGNQYVYAPDYETYFPASLSDWVLLRDFNCDGKKDLFTSDPAGISVFVNVTKPGGTPSWRPFNPGHPLLTLGYSGSINIQMNATDIPAIDDIDEDGDLDVIVARFVGFGSLEFHKNMSIENTGRCDSMQLVRVTTEWGNFQECICGVYAYGIYNQTCDQLLGGRVQHDVGKSLLTLDLNNDGLHDLIFSEETCDSLYLLSNHGTLDSAVMTGHTTFPKSKPPTLLFPAAYFEDLDFDGVKDLILATNISARVPTDIDLSNSTWLYKNNGTNKFPQFSFVKPNLLQDQMIDVGSYASPAFADFDNDGDLDMFISYLAIPDSVASIYLYQNTGSFAQPSFKFVTNDYQQLSTSGLFNIRIQFVDVNGDGKTDLAFTATSKQTYVTQLYYLKNNGETNFDFSGQNPEPLNFTIGQLDNVFLYDVNKDGLLDILWGASDGSLQFYKNTGSLVFVVADQSYMGLNSSIVRFCVSPTVSDLRRDGKPDLLVGNYGSIVIYPDFQSGQSHADTLLVDNQLKKNSEARDLSSFLVLTTTDLYSTNNPLVVAGTITGGLYILKSDSTGSNQNENTVSVWPNPLSQNEKINIRATQNSLVQLFTVLGQKLNNPIAITGGETIQVEQTLSSGLYIVRVSWSGKTQTMKLVIR